MASLSNEIRGVRQRICRLFRNRSRDPNNEQPQIDPPHTIQSVSTGASRHPLNRSRSKPREFSHDTQAEQVPATSNASASHFGTVSPQILNQTNAGNRPSTSTVQKGTAATPYLNGPAQDVEYDGLSLHESISSLDASLDIWSAAYREAVEGLGEEIATALSEKSAEQLFRELEEFEREAAHKSAFLRGVERLRSLKTPLDTFKLALDLASPLANLEPTASTVLGVVRSVTAIAITFANADIDFAKQIADMLGRISYIDECDALGQKAGRKDIHKALVSVYQKLLEFYNVALEILARKGMKLVMKLVSENDRLPSIVKDFLACADNLHLEIQKATMDILVDIRNMLYAQDISRWLKLDKLGHQSQLLGEWQKDRENKACEFLLEDSRFNTWYTTPESRQLVILGAKGHGKTFTMTFLAEELERRNRYQLPRPVLCQYYCRDDETGKATNVLCALIYSLLNHKQLEGLQKPFHERYKEALGSDLDPASNIVTLEKFLGSMLKTIDRPIFFVIDGIDECDEDSRNSLLNFLNYVLQTASGLKIILSARPRQDILDRLDDAIRIELVPNSKRDFFIVEKTLEKLPSRVSSDAKAQIQKSLSERMQGSGIWTKMIVQLINARRLTEKDAIDQFLEALPLPHQLSKVYNLLLSRCTSDDDENWQLADTALRVLAFSHRPLSILELAWAVATSLAQNVRTVHTLSKMVDHQRVMDLIHPFIASPDYDELRKPQVRLTHQSVKEWVRKLSHGNCRELKKTDETDEDYKNPDNFMLNICIKYLLLDEIGNTDLLSEEQAAFEQLPQLSGSFIDDQESIDYDRNCTWESWEDDMVRIDPLDRGFGEFFVYASCHWIDHFGGTGSTFGHLPSLVSIENVCQSGSIRLRNWIQQNCRPGCTMLPRFEFDSSLYDPLSITSLYGSEAALRTMIRSSSFDNGKYFQDTAMRAADQILQWGDLSRLKILVLDSRTGLHLKNFDLFRLIVKKWDRARLITNPRKERQNWDLVFDLVDDVTEKMIEDNWGNKLLCFAAGAGCMPIVQRLMNRAQHSPELRGELLGTDVKGRLSSHEEELHQSVGHAVLRNHSEIVEYLGEFGFEAHFRYCNARGENVLHLASKLCNPDMFRLLLPRLPEGIFAEDHMGETPLLRVIMSPSAKRYQCARRLLLANANRGTRCLDWQGQALRTAVSRCDLEMCSILICLGDIDPLAALIGDGEGQKNSKERGPGNDDNMLRILLDLFSCEGNPAVTDLRHLAEKQYIKCFDGYNE